MGALRMGEPPRRTLRLETHWSYYDAPDRALCGEAMRPEQFNRAPSCPVCLQVLARMRLEDQR